jgi:hypothetical protein
MDPNKEVRLGSEVVVGTVKNLEVRIRWEDFWRCCNE